MKKLLNVIVSTRTMAVLLLVYALAMAYATFVENDYGTSTAKALIYEAKWFELIMFLLILNFIGNIFRYRLLRKEKWSVLVFHLAFIFIFIGGAITRYISFEGVMHIREGEMSNSIVTDKNFFRISIEEQGDRMQYKDIPFMLASDKPLIAKITPHAFKATYDYSGQKISIRQVGYIQRKKDSLISNNEGKEYLHIVLAGESGRMNMYLRSGEAKNISGTLITFNRPIEGAIEFRNINDRLYIKTPVDATYMTMATQATGETKKEEIVPLVLRSLYKIGNYSIVVPEGVKKGDLVYFEGDKKKDSNLPDLLKVEVKTAKSKQLVDLSVEKGNPESFKQISIDGLNIMMSFGPKIYNTPFYVKLNDFVMETYPGSSTPSAYESHVTVIDEGKEFPYKIFMNNVLNYKGYRFFQASFDPDRLGTVLSVNHDWWGTLISYIGYAFLFVGMFVSFFWKGSHFWNLSSTLKSMNSKKVASCIILLLSMFGNLNAQSNNPITEGPSHAQSQNEKSNSNEGHLSEENHLSRNNMGIITADMAIDSAQISKEHAEKFGYLLVQNFEGRIVPINTQALEVLRKLYKSDKFKGADGKYLTANQWFLSVHTDSKIWTRVPIIKVSKGGEQLRRKVSANDEGYTCVVNLFHVDSSTNATTYVLEEDYKVAFSKKPSEQTSYDKAIIDLNDRVQVFSELFTGQLFRIVPVKNDSNHRWNSWLDQSFQLDMEAQQIIGPYLRSVMNAKKNGSWADADAELQKLSDYQHTWAKNVIPSDQKIKVEILLNKLDLNFKLLIFYTLIGGLLLVLGFIDLFKSFKLVNLLIKSVILIGCLGYVTHFLGLIARWYISGHAPWSNGYEAIIFISWVGITAGLLFYFGYSKGGKQSKENNNFLSFFSKKRGNALIPASGFMVAVIMMGFAHGGSALDPQITPLAPVLKSYWLIVHVAIITASYGFFALSMIIAVVVLAFYIISNKKQFKQHNNTTIKELTIVSEMSLTIGLFALTVGNFLGGIWANESWGRYWSWDPKETWALISIMVYALALHIRLVPELRGRWLFHVVAMFSFCSMVMTYFGVNYYLSGLHSYAAGDPVPIPAWVYIGLTVMTMLSVFSYLKFKKYSKV